MMPTDACRMMGYSEGQARSDPTLPRLRRAALPQALQRSLGGPHSLPQAHLLRRAMHGRWHDAGDGFSSGESLARRKAARADLRGMRDDRWPARPSSRRGAIEQRAGEHRDALRVVPPPMALAPWQEGEASRHVLRLRRAGAAVGVLRQASPALQEVRRPALDKAQGRRCFRARSRRVRTCA